MDSFELKVYDDTEDRSPQYCGGGAVLIGLMAWREYSTGGELGLRFVLMLLVMAGFAAAAAWLLRRNRITLEVVGDREGQGVFRIHRRGRPVQVISESQLAYVKLEKKQLMLHYYEDEDLRRRSVPIKGGSKKKLVDLLGILEKWQV